MIYDEAEARAQQKGVASRVALFRPRDAEPRAALRRVAGAGRPGARRRSPFEEMNEMKIRKKIN